MAVMARHTLERTMRAKLPAPFICVFLIASLAAARPAPGAAPQADAPPQPSAQALRLINQGFDQLARNAAPQAEASFRQAIEIQPELAAAHRGLGLALGTEGKTADAMRELTTATQLDPADADAHLALGKLAWTLSQQVEPQPGGAGTAASYQARAISELSKAASLRPKDSEIRLNLAELYLQAGRLKDSIEQATAAGQMAVSAREHARANVALGRALVAQGEQANAEEQFQKAIAADPTNADAHLGLGELRLDQRKIPEAQEEFRKAIQASPGYAPAYSALAELLVAQGRAGEARALLENAVRLDPRDWHSKFRLAGVLMDAGQSARATDLLNEVVRLNPGFLPAQEQLGLGLLRRGDLAGASKAAEKLMTADPQAEEGHRLMAFVLWKKRDLESSLAECANVLASNPDSVPVLSLEALELWQLDRKKQSREVFARAAKADRRLADSVFFCRMLYCDAADIKPVEDFLRKNRWVFAPPQP
jgi:tetratricopeptide (TPR) repeat protein